MRTAAIAGIGLLLAASIWFLLSDGSTRELTTETVSATPPTREEPAAGEVTQAPVADVVAARELTSRASTEPAVPEAPGEPLDPAPEGKTRVHGRVVVIDAEGGEHLQEDGELELVLWRGRSGRHDSAEVRAGHFTAEVPEDCELGVTFTQPGGPPCWIAEERFPLEPDLVIRANRLSPTLLEVVDAETGVPLAAVTVVPALDFRTDSCAHPGDFPEADALALREPSPLSLWPSGNGHSIRWTGSVWVGAQGYAWSMMELDFKRPRPRRCELKRGGTLEVRVTGGLSMTRGLLHPQEGSPRLRVREDLGGDPGGESPFDERIAQAIAGMSEMPDEMFPDGRPTEAEFREAMEDLRFHLENQRGPLTLEASLRFDAPVVLDGIAPGSYVVAAEMGEHFDNPLVLGEVPVVIELGQTTYATLPVEAPAEERKVPFSGTLLLPPAWELRSLDLNFEPLGKLGKTAEHERTLRLSDMQPVAGVDGLYRWNAGMVVPGRYLVQSYHLDSQWALETGPDGRTDAEIVVGAPADVHVRVVEAPNGLLVQDAQVLWNGKRPTGSSGGSLDHAVWNETTRTYDFRAPAGSVELSMWDRRFHITSRNIVELTPGSNMVTLEVRRSCGIELRFFEDGTPVALSDDRRWAIEVERVRDGGHQLGSGGLEDHGLYFKFAEPGTYEIRFPDLPEFEPVEPAQVEVPESTYVEHNVKLRRRS